jgi:hypothetical protein
MDIADRELANALHETLSNLRRRLQSLDIRSDIHPNDHDRVTDHVYQRVISVLFYANPTETVGEAFCRVGRSRRSRTAPTRPRRDCYLSYLDTAIRRLDESLSVTP